MSGSLDFVLPSISERCSEAHFSDCQCVCVSVYGFEKKSQSELSRRVHVLLLALILLLPELSSNVASMHLVGAQKGKERKSKSRNAEGEEVSSCRMNELKALCLFVVLLASCCNCRFSNWKTKQVDSSWW